MTEPTTPTTTQRTANPAVHARTTTAMLTAAQVKLDAATDLLNAAGSELRQATARTAQGGER